MIWWMRANMYLPWRNKLEIPEPLTSARLAQHQTNPLSLTALLGPGQGVRYSTITGTDFIV